jgi:tetratricopeptide (TPR) repeat protein/predicted nucleic acid-binding protein
VDRTFEVFISYGHEDAAWVRTLAENLERAGVRTFFDEWEIGPGDVLVHRLEAGLRTSRNGILVISPASVGRPWVQQEYAVMVDQAVAGTQRLIPVLLGEVELPPFAATRGWVDFRGADGPEYQRRFGELVAALKGKRPARPEADGRLVWPAGTGVRPEGARRAMLQIGAEQTVLAVDGEREMRGRPAGPTRELETRVWQAQRARRRRLADGEAMLRAVERQPDVDGSGVQQRLLEVGLGLAEAFLPQPVQAALAQAVADAVRTNSALRLGVEVAEAAWADLPWETLTLRDSARPLVLEPRVELYRAVPDLGATPAMAIRGPLRILVVIGSPDQGDRDERGELLDYEAELRRILDAVEAARRLHRAHVRILHRGTLAEVRAALQAQRFHVLHLSCHATPGWLVLEDDDGRPELVSAARLAEEALPAGRGVPLVVLAGCATALGDRTPAGKDDAEGEGEAALPGLARALLARGVPAVLAMNAAVTDPYATRLGGALYRELAGQQRPDPLGALSHARRQVDAELRAAPEGSREAHLAGLAEWATPTLFVRGRSLPLFDVAEGFEQITPPAEPVLAGVAVRAVGDFVGRRREERLLGRALQGQRAGVVVHGIGGVGKSTLAARLLADLGEQAGLVVSFSGALAVDRLFDELARRLLTFGLGRGWEEHHPLRRAIPMLRDARLPWRDRLGVLVEQLLRHHLVVLLLDNFEDNLTPTDDRPGHVLADPELAAFLAAWIRSSGMSRLLVTSRFPFGLPRQAHRRLQTLHLGPLSWAETRKLIWRLPGLDALDREQQQRAWTDVGGHPRSLEYLDALLHGGNARFDDIAQRLEATLTHRGIPDPKRWLHGTTGNLDRALAETVTLAVDEVLLGRLLARLDGLPLARRLLFGISVYRLPVDRIGVAWQVSEETESSEQAEVSLRVPDGLAHALAILHDLGLVTPVEPAAISRQDEALSEAFLVHRWTARALADLATSSELIAAHHRAARYWRWRVKAFPQDPTTDIAQLLEARHHHQAASELDDAVQATEWVCDQLHTWGAWSWEEQLCLETLAVVPERSRHAAAFTHGLGVIAQARGDYDQALDWYRKSLTINEDLGNRAGIATTYHQLGIVAYLLDDYDQALDWYRQALTIKEDLGNHAGMATTYGQLGMLAQARGEHDQALDWYRKSLTILERLGDRAAMASSYGQLGLLAQARGDYDQALDWYRKSLTINEDLGNRAGIATTYHNLGIVAYLRGHYDQALDWYRKSLTIFERLGDHAGMASTISQIGILLTETGVPAEAVKWNLRSLGIRSEIESSEVRIDLHWLVRQREMLGSQQFERIAREQLDGESANAVLDLLERWNARGTADPGLRRTRE